jgi:hypothetical protein
MSYQERRTIVGIISGILIVAAYCIYAFGRYQSGMVASGDLKFWAGTMLVFIGIGIVASIIIQIVFHILMSIAIAVKAKMLNEDCDDKEIEKTIGVEMVEDEMDKLIEQKALRVGFVLAGVGFVSALLALVLGYSAVVMLNILFFSFSVGAIIEGIVQLYFYRKGITNG